MNRSTTIHHWSLLLFVSATAACFNPEPGGSSGSNDGSSTTDIVIGSDSVSLSDPNTDTDVVTADGSGDTDGTADGTTGTTDATDDTTTGGCTGMGDCDDGVSCTEDACVDGECVNTPMDTLCDDRIDCTTDTCDAATGCVATPDDALCDDGVGCTTDTCDAATGCAATPDDALCDDGIMCTTNTCDAVMDCQAVPDDALCDDGLACTTDTCDVMADCQFDATILVFNGSNGGSSAPEDAVTNSGYTPILVTTEADFNVAYDAGGFDAIVIDVPSVFGTVPVAMQTRLDGWVAGGGRLIFGFWNLDEDAPMQTTLDVTVGASNGTTLPVFPDPASPVDLFDTPEMIMAPITYADVYGDNGDELTPNLGFTAGRFNDAMAGPGAIVVTRSDRVLTNGFMITEMGQDGVDADADMIGDGEELMRNEIEFVCSVP